MRTPCPTCGKPDCGVFRGRDDTVVDGLVKALRECAAAIETEVRAGDMDHPIIRAHAKTAQRARAALAEWDKV